MRKIPAMADSGTRHPLTLYRFMLDRWWRATLMTGIMLLLLAAGLGGLPVVLPQYHFMRMADWQLWILAGTGAFALIFSLFLIAIRRKATIQLFEKHLRVSTPFLRLNIAYSRINHITTSEMQHLFPPKRLSRWQKEMLRPLAPRVAVVLELSGFPIPRPSMLYFLSPFFFPDKTPRLALLVPDWIKFNTELESKFGAYKDSQHQHVYDDPRARLLNEITRPRK
jgi:hypothetical protein